MVRDGLDPATPIIGAAGGETLGDFWAWGYSNILTNNLRGVFAEFLVGTALRVAGGTRTEWDAELSRSQAHAGRLEEVGEVTVLLAESAEEERRHLESVLGNSTTARR